jgi:hypothetical protein
MTGASALPSCRLTRSRKKSLQSEGEFRYLINVLLGLSKPWVCLEWGRAEGREHREEIFDCIAGVVGAC